MAFSLNNFQRAVALGEISGNAGTRDPLGLFDFHESCLTPGALDIQAPGLTRGFCRKAGLAKPHRNPTPRKSPALVTALTSQLLSPRGDSLSLTTTCSGGLQNGSNRDFKPIDCGSGSDILRRIDIGMYRVSACGAPKDCLGWSVLLGTVATLATRLTGVGGVHGLKRNPQPSGLIGQEQQ